MITISDADYNKLVKMLAQEGQAGANKTLSFSGSKVSFRTLDRSNKEIIIDLSDVQYPFMPVITRSETF